jgi:hypothetical protein
MKESALGNQVDPAAVFQQARFNFMREARLWYWGGGNQQVLPELGDNAVVLSPEFYREITTHPIPTDLASGPGALRFAGSLGPVQLAVAPISPRARRRPVPLFGEFGLTRQLGIAEYSRPRKFRESASKTGSVWSN